jgi:hypothetical protein
MANKIKGEVALSYEGAAYTLVLDFNALGEFEAMIDEMYPPKPGTRGANAMVILQDPNGMNLREMTALFWAGLKQRHPELTRDDAGRILSDNLDKVGEALTASFPDAEEGKRKRA